jgi:non-specific serine/threonine protein kinase
MAYMSPEQARGEKLDARSDLFSFGVLIYQMATGQLPFAGSTTALVFDAILNREPAPLRRLRAELPQELEKIVSAALEKNREARVRSAADLKLALNDLKYRLESGLPAPAPVRGAKKFAFSFWQRRVPVLLILLALVGFASLSYLWLARRFSPAVRSLLVLPLENLPPVASQRYLADGMTDGLILELSRIASLQVIKAGRKPLTELARELRSSRLVDGSVSRSGEQVRVSIKVIETPNNQILWQESYQGGLGELPGLQSAAARDIVRILKIPVTPQELAELSRSRSINSEAYDAYLRGRQLWNRQTAKDLRSAAEEFRSSIDAAPNYAPCMPA